MERVSAAYTDGDRFSVYVYSPPVRCVCTYMIRVYSLYISLFTVVFSFFPFFLCSFFCRVVLVQFILPAILFANVEMCEIKVGMCGLFWYN